MRKILLTGGALAAIALVCFPRATPTVSEKFNPVVAVERQVLAANLAALPPAAREGAQDLGAMAVEKRIDEIDALIAEKKLVEKSNRGALSVVELSELRRLLALRNEYFARKLDFELGGES